MKRGWLMFAFALQIQAQTPFWQKLPGPYGGMCQKIIVATNGSEMYTVGDGTVYHSTNKGRLWQRISTRATALLLQRDGTLLAGSEGSIWRTTNEGTNWTRSDSGFYLSARSVLAFEQNSEGMVFCGARGPYTSSGHFGILYYLIDSGYHWFPMMGGDIDDYISFLAINPFNDDLFAAGKWTGVFRFIRNREATRGKTYTKEKRVLPSQSTGALSADLYDYFIRSMAFDSSGLIYAGSTKGIVFQSSDSGATWHEVSSRRDSAIITSLMVSPTDGRTLFAGVMGYGVFASTDSGRTWTQTDSGLTDVKVMALAANTDGDLFIGTFGSGVFASKDQGRSWNQRNIGMNTSGYVTVGPDGTVYVGTEASGIFASTNHGESWTQIGRDVPNSYISGFWLGRPEVGTSYPIYVDRENRIFVGVRYYDSTFALHENIYRSTNTGLTWEKLLASRVYSFARDEKKNILYVGTLGYGVYRSRDNGETWSHTTLMDYSIGSLLIVDSVVFAGSPGSGLYRSTDAGETWSLSDSGMNSHLVYSLAKNSQGILFSCGYEKAYRSTNNGNTWRQMISELQGDVWAIATNRKDEIFLSDIGGGIFLSSNNGDHWMPLNNGLDENIYSLAVDSADYIYGGSLLRGHGIYRLGDPATTDTQENDIRLPTSFLLSQNYPNPFNPSTVIRYSLPVASTVTLRVYNLLGEEVATLVNNEWKGAGEYSVAWNAGGSNPNGVYFYKLVAGSFRETKKLLLVR